jgi:hypothetical protein
MKTREERAKELFLKYNGNRFYMDREGDGSEYEGYHIPKETEELWAKEFIFGFLKTELKGREALHAYSTAAELLKRDRERNADYEEKMKSFQIRELEENLLKEEAEVKKTYPDFSLEKELENAVFKTLVDAGLDIKTAYEAAHLDELKAKKEAEKQTAEKKRRPVENGSLGGDSAIFKSGVYALTKKDRAALAKRAQKGETIRF